MNLESIDILSIEHIEYLSKNKISEDGRLEYKSMLSLNDDKSKKEFIKDVLAMANAEGGYIIVGIDEKNNYQLKGMSIENWDELELQMTNLVKDCSDPMFTDYKFKHFQLDNHNYVFAISIGKSALKPHRSKRDNCFYKRIGTQCVNLDVANLKQEILFTYLIGDENLKKDDKFVQEILDENIGNNKVVLTLTCFPTVGLYRNITQDTFLLLRCYNEMVQSGITVTHTKIVQNGVLLFDEERGVRFLIKKNGEIYFSCIWNVIKENLIDCRLFVVFEKIIRTAFCIWGEFYSYAGACSFYANLLKAKDKTLHYTYFPLKVDPFDKDRIHCNVNCGSSKDEESIWNLLDELCNAGGINSYRDLKGMFLSN